MDPSYMERRFRRDHHVLERKLSLAMLERGGGTCERRGERGKERGVDEGEERVPLAAAPRTGLLRVAASITLRSSSSAPF